MFEKHRRFSNVEGLKHLEFDKCLNLHTFCRPLNSQYVADHLQTSGNVRSKAAAEKALLSLAESGKVKVIAVRLPLVGSISRQFSRSRSLNAPEATERAEEHQDLRVSEMYDGFSGS